MSDRPLVMCWPGTAPHQRGLADVADKHGLLPLSDWCCQVNTELHGRRSYPDRLDLSGMRLERRMDVYLGRDWTPKPPAYAMLDHEPNEDGSSWVGQAGLNGYTGADCKFSRVAADAMRAHAKAKGLHLRLGIYGVPMVGKDGPAPKDHAGLATCGPMVEPWDVVYLNLYPPFRYDRGWLDDAAAHRARVETAYTRTVAATKREVIPKLWLRWGMDARRYAEVYCDTLAELGCKKLGVWLNPRGPWEERVYGEQLAAAAPALLGFAKQAGGVTK